MPRKRSIPRWVEALIRMYKDGRLEMLDGEVRAYMGTREVYYDAKRILVETGMAELRTTPGGALIWRINWDVVKKHPVTKEYFEEIEKEEEGGETHEE